MYRRFLNNSDYLGIITQEALQQLTRGNDERFIQAEQSAEMSIVEYLSENYEVEKELAKGKYIADYDRRITYPVGVHIYFDGQIHEVIRYISGYRKPATVEYWEESTDINIDASQVPAYSQFNTYYPGDKVNYNGVVYLCLSGIRMPGRNRYALLHGTFRRTGPWTPRLPHERWARRCCRAVGSRQISAQRFRIV